MFKAMPCSVREAEHVHSAAASTRAQLAVCNTLASSQALARFLHHRAHGPFHCITFYHHQSCRSSRLGTSTKAVH